MVGRVGNDAHIHDDAVPRLPRRGRLGRWTRPALLGCRVDALGADGISADELSTGEAPVVKNVSVVKKLVALSRAGGT